MNYTIYNNQTGQIVSNFTTSDPATLALNVGSNSYIEGHYALDRYYVENNQAVSIPAKPADTLTEYTFDWTAKTWTVDQDGTAMKRRARRNSLLIQTVDRINPVWYAALTAEQQAELSVYRTALLNVPQQAGWPTAIEWPTQPTWI